MSPPPTNPPRLRLRVTATAETILRGGHPWLFADSIREQNRPGQPGELAVIYDRKDKFLAVGLFDPDSPIRVRVLHAGKPVTIDESWWRENLARALRLRENLFDDRTNGYRCLNGESDHWPGLVLDRYAGTFVLKIYTAAWLPRLGEIAALIGDTLKPARLVVRLSRNIQETARKNFQLEDGVSLFIQEPRSSGRESAPSDLGEEVRADSRRLLPSEEAENVIFLETGIRFEADVVRGQKTGFFLDQRENRRRVEALARGGDVLNAFSFSGGFSLYAARGGAKSVTDLDISAHALESAQRNFALNQTDAKIAACRHETIQTDAFAWLEKNTARKFDVVILDPPSLAKRETERAGAIQAYGKLAANGLKALNPGGVLVAASCSAHVSAAEFFEAVRGAAQKPGRRFTELETTLHAPDHHATFPEAQYLKCIFQRG
jgi:23S rRNA (cytosine1962-C5)-methyltransferase